MDGGAGKSGDKARLLLHVHVHVLQTLPQASPFTSWNNEVKQLYKEHKNNHLQEHTDYCFRGDLEHICTCTLL